MSLYSMTFRNFLFDVEQTIKIIYNFHMQKIALFDLDGTVTSKETLPVIASHFNCQEEIAELTKRTVAGNVPFIESFIRRVNILGKYSVSETNKLLAQVPLYPELKQFIDTHRADCIIVTGNLTCWCEGLFRKIGCQC